MHIPRIIALCLSCCLLAGCAQAASTEPTEPVNTLPSGAQIEPEPTDTDGPSPDTQEPDTSDKKPELMQGPGPFGEDTDYETWQLKNDAYQTWLEAFRSKADLDKIRDSYQNFTARTTKSVFETIDTSQNGTYSPLSMYAAVCMLTQCANGDTQANILSFLHLDSLEDAQGANRSIYHGLSFLEGNSALTTANSMWLNKYCMQDGVLDENTIADITEKSYAELRGVRFGSEEADSTIKSWIEDETRGLISPDIKTMPDTLSMLINALYYKDSWMENFPEHLTEPDVFHNQDGTEIQTDFMHKTDSDSGTYIKAENYAMGAIKTRHGEVRFVLPDESISVNDLLYDESVLKAITDTDAFQDAKRVSVQWSVPKFDASSDFDLTQAMIDAGIGEIGHGADFTRLSKELEIYVSQIRQLCHVKADEDGFEAAAVTIITMDANCVVLDEPIFVDMTLDRPFIFVIMSQDMPLFIGVINTMNAT